jgi:dTDP-4-dehydrorhamnose reductase
MTLLILGGGGMLGHKLWQTAAPRMTTWVTMRGDGSALPDTFDRSRIVGGVHAEQFDTVVRAFELVRPDVVVNCLGVVKQRADAADPLVALTVNGVFPHRVAALCAAAGSRLVHISTDCVFSGQRGGYVETDPPDAIDLYGRTKHLGEVSGPGCLTLRTSIIGRELATSRGLVEWFLGTDGIVPGYTHAVFSGVTTAELSRVILHVIAEHPALAGVYHVAAEPISKHDLLVRLNVALGRGATIRPDPSVRIDRSLDGRRFAAAASYAAPPWDRMIEELSADVPAYETWRQHAR